MWNNFIANVDEKIKFWLILWTRHYKMSIIKALKYDRLVVICFYFSFRKIQFYKKYFFFKFHLHLFFAKYLHIITIL